MYKEVADGIGEEKTVISSEILLVVSLVVPNFVFFPFLGSARDHDMATRVGESISRCWDDEIGCFEPISGGFGAGKGVGGENGCGDVAVACASSVRATASGSRKH